MAIFTFRMWVCLNLELKFTHLLVVGWGVWLKWASLAIRGRWGWRWVLRQHLSQRSQEGANLRRGFISSYQSRFCLDDVCTLCSLHRVAASLLSASPDFPEPCARLLATRLTRSTTIPVPYPSPMRHIPSAELVQIGPEPAQSHVSVS